MRPPPISCLFVCLFWSYWVQSRNKTWRSRRNRNVDQSEWLSSQFLSNQHIPLGQRSSIWKQNLDKVQILHFLKSLCLGQQTCRSAWRLWYWNWKPSPFSWSMKCNLSLLLVYPTCKLSLKKKDWTLVPGDIRA